MSFSLPKFAPHSEHQETKRLRLAEAQLHQEKQRVSIAAVKLVSI
jgi:hypothetical protein